MARVRLMAWRGSGEGDVVGVAAVELVEIGLTIEGVVIVCRGGRLRVVLPGAASRYDGEVPRPVLRWGSAEIARRFAGAVIATIVARYPLDIAAAVMTEPALRPAARTA